MKFFHRIYTMNSLYFIYMNLWHTSQFTGQSVKQFIRFTFIIIAYRKHCCWQSKLQENPKWDKDAWADHIPTNFLKVVFHKFYLVNSWILRFKWCDYAKNDSFGQTKCFNQKYVKSITKNHKDKEIVLHS